MTTAPISAWQRLSQRLASTKGAAWLFSYIMTPIDRWIINLSGRRFSLTSLVTGLSVVTLTAVGAKSGQPRSVPLVAMFDGEKVILVASNWGQKHHPSWYHNLKAHPEAQVMFKGVNRNYVAEEISGEVYEKYWAQAVATYVGYKSYQTRTGGRKIPMFVLTPAG